MLQVVQMIIRIFISKIWGLKNNVVNRTCSSFSFLKNEVYLLLEITSAVSFNLTRIGFNLIWLHLSGLIRLSWERFRLGEQGEGQIKPMDQTTRIQVGSIKPLFISWKWLDGRKEIVKDCFLSLLSTQGGFRIL